MAKPLIFAEERGEKKPFLVYSKRRTEWRKILKILIVPDEEEAEPQIK